MNQQRLRLTLLAVCFLVCTGLALDCDWDHLKEQGLDPTSLLDPVWMLSDPESCRDACCNSSHCDLDLVGNKTDGKLQCQLVTCDGRDACVLQRNAQFQVLQVKTEMKKDVNTLQIVPQLVLVEPKTHNTNEDNDILPDESPPAPPVKVAQMAPSFTTEMSADDFAERCEADPEVGFCKAYFRRWYYNKETHSCQVFIYGGCRGNKNNYDSEESCMTACTVSVLPSSKRTAADVKDSAEYKDQCMVTPDSGPCRAAFPMFYYDPNTSTCQSFMYGGCRGNQNRYGTEKECMSRCGEIGLIGTHGRTRDRWTAAVFLFVTLASISALLLATLVVITLRRHRLSRHPSSISDKEELLPDPDEQSSVDSLTVPESPQPDKA